MVVIIFVTIIARHLSQISPDVATQTFTFFEEEGVEIVVKLGKRKANLCELLPSFVALNLFIQITQAGRQ